jgi:hypothetical protein
VYSFNPRAWRVYEKAGFRAEGVLRESLRYAGQWIDATVMSILASEWAEHHGHPSQGTRLGPGGAGPLRRDVRASCQPAEQGHMTKPAERNIRQGDLSFDLVLVSGPSDNVG